MKKLFTLFAVLLFVIGGRLYSQNVNVAGALVGNGSYATLQAAFTAINGGVQTGANIVITITGSTTETGTATLNAGAWTTLSIQPSGGAARTVSGAITAGLPLVDLNGADNVTIDGLNSGGNSLTFSNTTISATSGTSTIRFIADATNNIITRCSIQGSSTMAVGTNGGNIFFSTATATGNDNNTISFCDIGPAGANLPTKGIYGNGTTTSITHYNSGINISNNNIFDYFGVSVQSAGIYMTTACTDWTISSNRFYQTAARTQVTTGTIHAGIQLASANINNCTITNNIIGYSSSAGTGTYTFTGVSTASRFYPIYLSAHGTTTATSIQGNTVTAINVSGPVGGTSTSAPFAGILVSSGLANIGNITGNTVGSTSVSGSITFSSSSASSSDVYGIYFFPSAVSVISNNSVGGITLGTTSTGNAVFYGLRAFTTTTVTNTFANNTVGYSAAPIVNNSTVTTSRVIGLYSQTGASIVSGNIISNMSLAAANTGAGLSSAVLGMWLDGTSATTAHNISQNIVHTLSGSGAGAVSVTGMYLGMSTLTNTVTRNFVHSLNATNTAASLQGMYVGAGNATYSNNMIRLGIDASGSSITTAVIIYGIVEVTGSNNFYHNSIYIGGSGVGATANNTIALNSIVTLNTRAYVNNILQNSRSNAGAGGPHYGIRLSGTGINPTGLTSNYNVIYVNGTGGIFGFYNASTATLSDWQTATGQDANSISGADPQFINPTGSSSTVDLHIHPTNQTPVEATGTNIPAITVDYDGQTRGTLTPVDIGADAGNFTAMPAMVYVSSTTTQNTAVLGPGGVNQQIIGIQIVTANIVSPLQVTSMTLNTLGDQGTTNDADLTNARIFYTGTSSTFSTTTQFGSTISSPTGSMVFNGASTLASGTNYFWLAYDISGSATAGNFVDALVNSVTGSGSMGVVVPSPNSPTGGRMIVAPLSGTYTVGATFFDNFPSLTGSGGAFERINSLGMAGNVTLLITTDLTETGLNALNQWTESGAGGYTLRIVPVDAIEKLISGSVANTMIRFNGNDRVTIDGNNGLDVSGTKYLRFRNTNGSNPTFSFFNDSKRNTITNCYIESNNANISTAPGTILFGTTTGTEGNDSNTISDCDIRDNSDASGTPALAIFSSGTTTTAAHANSNNTVTGCNIYNFYQNGATTHGAFFLLGGTTAWTISNNSIYQTVTRTTTISSGVNVIFLSNATGDGYTITGNFIGGTAPNCGGTPWTMNTVTSSVTNFIYPIRFSSAGVTNVSTVSNNTIQNIDLTLDNPVTAGTLYFDAMLMQVGAINISNNTIGSQSSSSSIRMTVNTGAISSAFFGIDMRGAIGSVTNNTVGGFTMAGTNTGACIMVGINEGSTSTTAINVTGNTIGGSISNSMQDSRGGSAFGQITGIRSSQAGATLSPSISNNTIRNMTDFGNGAGFMAGISHSGTSRAQIDNNTITALNSGTSLTGAFSGAHSMCGISLTGTAISQSISGNTISNINNTYTGANNTYIFGLQITSSTAVVTEQKNQIYGITNQSTGTAPVIAGINHYWGTTSTSSNNMVTITNGEPVIDNSTPKLKTETFRNNINDKITIPGHNSQDKIRNIVPENRQKNNPPPVEQKKVRTGEGSGSAGDDRSGKGSKDELLGTGLATVNEEPVNDNPVKPETHTSSSTNGVEIYGIYDDATTPWTYYYNSVYVGGSASSGANNSYTFRKTSPTHVLRNNMFVNARTGGTGKHYVVFSTSTTAGSLNSNYNVYLGSNASTIGLWGVTDQTIDQWRTSIGSGRDMQTWSTTTGTINPSNLFTNIGSGNLSINNSNTEAWLSSGKGIAIGTINSDFFGNSRVTSISSGVTDIGAQEYNTPGVNPPAAIESAPPAGGTTTTYTQWGRTVASIDWGSGGSSYPSTITIVYFSGVNPPNVLGGNYASSYSSATATGSLADATYDITYFFGDNETFTISTPNTNTVLAKYGASWEVYPLGTNPWQTQLTYNTGTGVFTTKVIGLYDFSNFALTDGSNPLPVVISEFYSVPNGRDANLRWVTTTELNNRGFAVERRLRLTGEKDAFTIWSNVAFIDGRGTTNEPVIYTYVDKKLNSGTYQYRLKQMDFNGHPEYFTPSQADVIIGKPGNFELGQNYPNPSNPVSKIDFQLPFDAKVSIKVYDILGQEVKTLVDGFKTADFYTVEFDGSNVASGTYFYRIIAEGNNQKFTKTLKMILVK